LTDNSVRRAVTIDQTTNLEQKTQIILYSRPGCHLCEEMKAEMAGAGGADRYELNEIDIATDAALWARYRDDIPVLAINGVEAFKHRLTAADFLARLKGFSA